MRSSRSFGLLAAALICAVCTVFIAQTFGTTQVQPAGERAMLAGAAAPTQVATASGPIRIEWGAIGLVLGGGLILFLRPRRRVQVAPHRYPDRD